jgi:hypothetical protein
LYHDVELQNNNKKKWIKVHVSVVSKELNPKNITSALLFSESFEAEKFAATKKVNAQEMNIEEILHMS